MELSDQLPNPAIHVFILDTAGNFPEAMIHDLGSDINPGEKFPRNGDH